MSFDSLLLLLAGGMAAGIFGALLGLGGGVFLIPFLVLFLHIPMHQAVATSIVAVIATSSAGASMNLEKQTVNVRLGMLLETSTVAGAIAGGLTASLLDASILTKVFAVVLVVISAMMILGENLRGRLSTEKGGPAGLSGQYFDEAVGSTVLYSVKNVPATMLVSLLAGNVSGLLGLGGGIFKVPAMHLVSGIPLKAAAATSNFMIGVTAAAGAFIYLAEGHLDPHIAAPASLGVLAGSFLGIRMNRFTRPRLLNRIFVAVLLFTALQLYLRT